MQTVVLANIISFIGSLIMVLVGLIKTRRNILLAQVGMFSLLGISQVQLQAYSGVVANIVSISRNLLGLAGRMNRRLKILFIVLQIAAVALTNSEGWLAWLPVVSTVLFTWFMDSGNEKLLKCVIILGQLMWLVYDISCMNYASAVFDLFAALSNGIGIAMLARSGRKGARAEE